MSAFKKKDLVSRSQWKVSRLFVDIVSQLNSGALHRLSSWYTHTLRSLWWVDSLGSAAAHCLVQSSADEQPDPLVMAAWRCSNLEEIILLGWLLLL